MTYDINLLRHFYEGYADRVNAVRKVLNRPLTYAEKVLFAHLHSSTSVRGFRRGVDYANFTPDRVAMQDATAQMALLQFMNAGRRTTSVPATVHCDHLICATDGAVSDLAAACRVNAEVYEFLQTAAARYGLGFWKPGAGIIHQVLLENYAFPGGMMIGTDSHTPNAGGMGMVAIGVGGADASDVMAGLEWELKVPRLIGVRLTGHLSAWSSPKDVILELAGRLTVKGATNAIIEYFGDGVASLPCTGRATICNMGAEVGATTSVFPYDDQQRRYLVATERADVAGMADSVATELQADVEVYAHPENHYDEVITIDLAKLTPRLNGPFTPDACCPVTDMPARVRDEGFPDRVEVVLIGSCTNSSYQDLSRAASLLRAGLDVGLKVRTALIVNPGSELIRATAERDGLLDTFRSAGAVIMTNACGPCIGQWHRKTDDPLRRNSIVTTFNRNFAKRADGNPNTFAFIASPEIAVGYAFSGSLSVHPSFSPGFSAIAPAVCPALPPEGFASPTDNGYVAPPADAPEPVIRTDSERIHRLTPFAPWNGCDLNGLRLLIKTKGKCTTDHISMAGPWLKYRGHLQNISRNLLMGATNAFNGKTNAVRNPLTGDVEAVSAVATAIKAAGGNSIIVAEDNYGEGSSREHAAMEPRFLGVRVVLAKSFARIHETNLKKQGMLALTFVHPSDYDLIREDDTFDIACADMTPDRPIAITLHHTDGTTDLITAVHTYNEQQLEWFRAGSALNALAAKVK